MATISRGMLLAGLFFLSISSVGAQTGEEPPLPSHETLARLLSYESQGLENQIRIGVVVRGETALCPRFKTRYAVHVTFIWPVFEGGRQVRESATRIFLWNEDYGWFTYFEAQDRGSAVINVCSELKGFVEIR